MARLCRWVKHLYHHTHTRTHTRSYSIPRGKKGRRQLVAHAFARPRANPVSVPPWPIAYSLRLFGWRDKSLQQTLLTRRSRLWRCRPRVWQTPVCTAETDTIIPNTIPYSIPYTIPYKVDSLPRTYCTPLYRSILRYYY